MKKIMCEARGKKCQSVVVIHCETHDEYYNHDDASLQ